MINRKQTETILTVNGVSITSPDEKIRSVLISARYTEEEVQSALIILRQKEAPEAVMSDSLNKVFRTDEALRPSEISQLLGIEVNHVEVVAQNSKGREMSFLQMMMVGFLSVVFAVAGIMFYMHLNEAGFFHPSSKLVSR